MLKIGLTGGIGSGKTTVASLFSELGVPVYFADREAKRLMETDPDIRTSVEQLFGAGAYEKGSLNRRYIGEIVFTDKEMLQRLNGIIHPAVQKDFDLWSEHHNTQSYVIEEAAILFESGGAERMDRTVFVKADEHTRIKRVMERDHISEAQVRARMKNQWKDEKKENLADFIIYNENDSMILPQIVDLHKIFLKLNS